MWQKVTAAYRNVIKTTFGRHLLLTNTLSSGGLLFVGDFLQQKNELRSGVHASHKFDWARSGRMFLVGISQGPPHHYW